MNPVEPNENLSGGFEPHMLIEAVREQAPEYPWLPEALASCGSGQWESRAYVRYVPCQNPNQPGDEWQFETSVALIHETFGVVVIDLLKGGRLGGIEFVDRIEV